MKLMANYVIGRTGSTEIEMGVTQLKEQCKLLGIRCHILDGGYVRDAAAPATPPGPTVS